MSVGVRGGGNGNGDSDGDSDGDQEREVEELPHLTAMAPRWDQLVTYDVEPQLDAIIDGLLGRAPRPSP
ncbi:hypothetical protein ACIBCM_19750 [Streptomyces sp. NPDC051018]|uniref:hypothetical protein n=1 Tax=Streptomyces sp. NPDC051018 TaxID=3365639 RepID=UPI0037AA0412